MPSENGRRKLAASGKLAVNRALRGLLSNSIEAVGLPRIWRYLDSLPVNAQGKTTYAELIALLERERPSRTKPRRRLIEQSAQRAVFELIAQRDLLYFDGHFPSRQILPGVVKWIG